MLMRVLVLKSGRPHLDILKIVLRTIEEIDGKQTAIDYFLVCFTFRSQ